MDFKTYGNYLVLHTPSGVTNKQLGSQAVRQQIYTLFTKLGDHQQKKDCSENNNNKTQSSDFTLINLRAIFSHRVSSETIIYLNSE